MVEIGQEWLKLVELIEPGQNLSQYSQNVANHYHIYRFFVEIRSKFAEFKKSRKRWISRRNLIEIGRIEICSKFVELGSN